MESADRAVLFSCPVRTRYARQIFRYRRGNLGWVARLSRGRDARDEAVTDLRALLRDAEEGTGYYAGAFAAAGVTWRDLRSREDLAHFPTLPRPTLQARYFELFHRAVGGDDVDEGWLGTTSGSTGEPVRFFMDAPSIHFYLAFIRFLWARLGLGALPRPGSTGIVLLCTLPRSAIYGTRLPLLRFTRFRKLHWEEPRAPETLARLAPAVITGDPDSLARLADAAEGGLRVRPRLILSSAFALDPALAARLAIATGARVVDYYSMAETGPIAWRCGEGVLHALDGAVELERDRGELLVTNLRNRLFPLVRYRTGDLGEVDEVSCRCGTRGLAITRFDGRVAARFVRADGAHVDPSQLQPILSALPVSQFQLVQTAPDAATLRYHAHAMLDATALAPLESALSRLLAASARVTLEHSPAPLRRPGEKPLVYRRGQPLTN